MLKSRQSNPVSEARAHGFTIEAIPPRPASHDQQHQRSRRIPPTFQGLNALEQSVYLKELRSTEAQMLRAHLSPDDMELLSDYSVNEELLDDPVKES